MLYGHGRASPTSELQFGLITVAGRPTKGHYQNVISQVMQPHKNEGQTKHWNK